MIKTDIRVGIDYDMRTIKSAICEALPILSEELSNIEILRKQLKLDGSSAEYALTVGIELSEERESGLLKMRKKVKPCESLDLNLPKVDFSLRPVVVGAGPAGLFAALILSLSGTRPIVLERGLPVDERALSVQHFFENGDLDTESNVQFGEGGAGAFSDGKLKVGSIDKYKRTVLSEFVKAGAPEEIMYLVGAHLGTDKLPGIVKNIRKKIIENGGELIFSARLFDIDVKNGEVVGCGYVKDGREAYIETDKLIIAAGHSATDIFELLNRKGAPLESRGFGIGLRIEHPREYINKLIYKDSTLADKVGTASYHLVTHLKGGRSVYSFCMCPGGSVVPATNNPCRIVTNGMSPYARREDNSNAALLVSVTPDDFGSDDALAGVYFQREIEKRAYSLTGSFKAPAIRLDDFMRGNKPVSDFSVKPSYAVGTVAASVEDYMPSFFSDSLREGIVDFDAWLPGFEMPEATLTGPETRSTSPVRVLRGDDFAAIGIKGLYPIGEGAGYAGGIVSSAYDGVRCAESIILKTKNNG